MSRQRHLRTGFTLVELLVVMAIIVVLVSLVTAGVMRWVDTQVEVQAHTRMHAIHQALTQQWNKVLADAEKEPIPPNVQIFAGSDAGRARVVLTYLRLIEAFPVNFDEINSPTIYSETVTNSSGQLVPLLPTSPKNYRKYVSSYKTEKGSSSGGDKLVESSSCLYLALRRGRSGAVADLESYARDTNNDGVPELVDDWGSPIAFFRFPAGNTASSDAILKELGNRNPAPSGSPQAKFANPLDPDGRLIGNWSSTYRPRLQLFAHKINAAAGQLPAYYTIPVIVSAGPDQKMGLRAETMETLPNPAPDDSNGTPLYWEDNLYSYKLRANQGSTEQ